MSNQSVHWQELLLKFPLSMALLKVTFGFTLLSVLSFTGSLAHPGFSGWGGTDPIGGGGVSFGLFPEFYQFSCPQANDIVMSVLKKAIAEEPRMAASILRLHFHDCFVQVSHLPTKLGLFLLLLFFIFFFPLGKGVHVFYQI